MLHFLCPRKFPAKFSWNYLFGSEVDFLSHHCIFTVAITGYLPLKKALQFMLTHFEFPSSKNVLCLVGIRFTKGFEISLFIDVWIGKTLNDAWVIACIYQDWRSLSAGWIWRFFPQSFKNITFSPTWKIKKLDFRNGILSQCRVTVFPNSFKVIFQNLQYAWGHLIS